MPFETKDSGAREEYASGMVRDTQAGKPRYDLLDRPFLRRWAELMARGADKYGEDNWRNADSEVELGRFQASALRHLFQWLEGDTDEDHAAAVAFNLAAAEYVKARFKRSGEGRASLTELLQESREDAVVVARYHHRMRRASGGTLQWSGCGQSACHLCSPAPRTSVDTEHRSSASSHAGRNARIEGDASRDAASEPSSEGNA